MSIENLRTPLGRLVGGNPVVKQQVTDFYTKQPKLDQAGQPIDEYRCEVAFPKKEFMEQIWPLINQEVSANYPQYANIHPDQYENSKFSWKVINGDSPACPKGSNVPYNTREGYPGNYIVKIRTSAFAPSVFKYENGAYRKIENNEIKTGDYVAVNVNVTCHKENDGGLYWNPNGFELVAYGKEIKGAAGGNPEEMFGRQTYNLPQGASTMPISSAPATAPMPQAMPQAPQNFQNPSSVPAVGVTQVNGMANVGTAVPQMNNGGVNTVTPVNMPAPAYDFVQNAGMPQAQPAPMAMPQAQPVFNQSVANVAGQQQTAHPMAATTAPFVTTFPSR
ncbi:MAG: hypothetical protein J6W96_00960 [Alphaproteobacteria bacterium]|nr:hypothetical protein [Alphaproteobacteria bacterium]